MNGQLQLTSTEKVAINNCNPISNQAYNCKKYNILQENLFYLMNSIFVNKEYNYLLVQCFYRSLDNSVVVSMSCLLKSFIALVGLNCIIEHNNM